jgi:Cu/Ag efflux protein CusF
MFNKLLSGAFAILIATTSFAMAENASGVVKSVDVAAMTLTLEDGLVVQLPAASKDQAAKLKAGDKVKVEWEKKGNVNEASSVTME